MPEDLQSILKALSNKKWFSEDQYNRALIKFSWSAHESTDRPQSVRLDSKTTKLKGKAISNWVHIRNWPIIIEPFIKDSEDSVLMLGLKLHELVERITANSFYPYELELLKETVLSYLDLRKEERIKFPAVFQRPKPRHHFIR